MGLKQRHVRQATCNKGQCHQSHLPHADTVPAPVPPGFRRCLNGRPSQAASINLSSSPPLCG